MMSDREEIIKKYFGAWINNNSLVLKDIFDRNIMYSECYGPEYHGINTIKTWFEDWNKRGEVLIWDIKQFVHQGNISVVEWYFKCKYDGEVGEFDGVSLIEFNDDNYIVTLKEFQSKVPHYSPYEN